ncbi:cyclophilin-like fold protein [Corynebacterium atrinae]|uniref:cyclophilin-like fold protein n=1 Tax=Corynebacterium atrinae TaxID=1336740 RepID=UPI0025B2A331|nr:cyclophilin-like fold protein [Corynebacterium atrinae]
MATVDGGLTMEGMPSGDDPEVSDLGYYAPNGVVVLYTGEVGFWNGIARIDRMEGDQSVTIERAG